MGLTGYMIAGVLTLLCSYVLVFILVVANVLKQDTALKYIRYSMVFVLLSGIISLLLSFIGRN